MKLSRTIIGCAMHVHSALGPGLLESVCEECLCREFEIERLAFRRQVEIPVAYRDRSLDAGFRLDLLVEETVIVEVKAIEQILRVHEAQLLTYLRMTGKRLGLLINFNVAHLRDGIQRKMLWPPNPLCPLCFLRDLCGKPKAVALSRCLT